MRSLVSPLPCKGLESQLYILTTVKGLETENQLFVNLKKLTLQGKLSQENLEKSLDTN